MARQEREEIQQCIVIPEDDSSMMVLLTTYRMDTFRVVTEAIPMAPFVISVDSLCMVVN